MNHERQPLVSIITPAYNSSRFIGEAIKSVQAQTYQNWEMIVADDCSKDNTVDVVTEFARSDDRIRLIRLSKNSGPAVARNAALEVAKGRYCAFLDSDDLWLRRKLERQISFMQERDAAISYTLYRRLSESGNECGNLIQLSESFSYTGLLKNTGIACLTVMVDRSITGPLQFSRVRHEDYALWLKLLKQGLLAYGLMEDLARYRVSGKSVSANKTKSAMWVWNIYRNVENLSLLYSAWCFSHYAFRAYLKNRKF